jgi:pimeloyl-ACP methyl ester carboxylesterase
VIIESKQSRERSTTMLTQPDTLQMPYPPTGELIDIGGRCLHWQSAGQGGPTVVLEAAIWDFSLTWALVAPEVAKFTRVVTYDRAGLGWSDPVPGPRSAEAMVADLHALLHAAHVPGPYVLVGQSFSGMLVRLFAYRYPDEVAGLVLLDSAHEDQYQRFPGPIRAAFEPMRTMQLQALGQVRDLVAAQGPAATPPLVPVPARLPAATADMYRTMAVADPTRLDTMIAELGSLENSQDQVRAARATGLGNLPLVVLSHGQAQAVPGMPDDVNAAYEAAWQTMQTELAALSTNGRRQVVEQAGHMIHHDQPEMVVDAIRAVVEQARAGR